MTETRFAQFKLVLLGESAVGKSSIVHRFVKNTFDDMRESTIGAAFLTQTITLPEVNTTVKFEIWDTAGQERYKSLAPMYYRNANAALCVYDITSQSSFQKAQDWIKELKKQAPEGIVVALVGNKADLSEQREVDEAEVEQYLELLAQEAEQDGSKAVIHKECSAKSGEGVLDIFNSIARALPVEQAGNRRGGHGAKKVELDRKLQPHQQQSCCWDSLSFFEFLIAYWSWYLGDTCGLNYCCQLPVISDAGDYSASDSTHSPKAPRHCNMHGRMIAPTFEFLLLIYIIFVTERILTIKKRGS